MMNKDQLYGQIGWPAMGHLRERLACPIRHQVERQATDSLLDQPSWFPYQGGVVALIREAVDNPQEGGSDE
jgi:hypothetical protein